LTAGDISDKYYGCAHSTVDGLFGFTRNRDKALELLTGHLRRELQSTCLAQGPVNSVLATIMVLCYYELKWPSTGLWKIHLQAARTMIRRWTTSDLIPTSPDPTKSFLIQELFATNVMVSVTNFEANEELVSVTLASNDKAPFIGFLHVIQHVTVIERGSLDTAAPVVNVGTLELKLVKAREHAFNFAQSLAFRSRNTRKEFYHVVDIFFHAGLIYLYRSLLSERDADARITGSRNELFKHRRGLNVEPFAQDLPWPLFIAGTECAGMTEDQECVESRMHEMVRLCGTLDRLKALGFLKEFWKMREQGYTVTWIEAAREWAKRGESFLIW
jgi:hypothetical protein